MCTMYECIHFELRMLRVIHALDQVLSLQVFLGVSFEGLAASRTAVDQTECEGILFLLQR
jgi:hypothetical protein